MKKVMFIGQAMPRTKRNPHDWPSLNNWLYSIDLTYVQIKKYFYYSALVDYFPGAKNGSHLVPTSNEVEKERPRLKKMILNFNPDIVVTVGKLSAFYCLGFKVNNLGEVIGKKFSVDPYGMVGRKITVIPLPHPSGASTWRHNRKNLLLLKKALNLLRINLSSR